MRFHRRALVAAIIAVTLLTACQQGPDVTGGPADAGAASAGPTSRGLGELPVSDAPGDGRPSKDAPQSSTRGVVSGRVLTAGAVPVSGAVVQPRSLDVPAKPVPELVVVTDANGAFEWRLEPGRYELVVNPPPGSSAGFTRQTVTVARGSNVTVDFAPR